MGAIAIVLAAGEGTRMKSSKPKPLFEICGVPMLELIISTLERTGIVEKTVVVVGHGAEEIKKNFSSREIIWAFQKERLGTAHAVGTALAEAKRGGIKIEDNDFLITAGDSPLIRAETLKKLFIELKSDKKGAVVMVSEREDPTGYGRIILDSEGNIIKIVEEPDVDEQTRNVKLTNSSAYSFKGSLMEDAMASISNNNSKGEYYLVDAIELIRKKGLNVGKLIADEWECVGINDRKQLSEAESRMRTERNSELMISGVTIEDPLSTYVDIGVRIMPDVILRPNTFLKGSTLIESGSVIGPSTIIENSVIGKNTKVLMSVVRDCSIDDDVDIGPFASLRPGTKLKNGSKAGTFVEIKNSTVGAGSKVPHLSYMGDADIGDGVNVGAGSITCNYDGFEKFKTIIEDGAFLGSDTMLVAPVKIGEDSTTGAGSVITKDVPKGALAVERTGQRVIENWKEKKSGKTKDD